MTLVHNYSLRFQRMEPSIRNPTQFNHLQFNLQDKKKQPKLPISPFAKAGADQIKSVKSASLHQYPAPKQSG